MHHLASFPLRFIMPSKPVTHSASPHLPSIPVAHPASPTFLLPYCPSLYLPSPVVHPASAVPSASSRLPFTVPYTPAVTASLLHQESPSQSPASPSASFTVTTPTITHCALRSLPQSPPPPSTLNTSLGPLPQPKYRPFCNSHPATATTTTTTTTTLLPLLMSLPLCSQLLFLPDPDAAPQA